MNELAPRPHNSGHYTIEACETSQFENHLRGVLDLPLGEVAMRAPAAAMVNLLGSADRARAAGRGARPWPSRAPTCTSTTRPRSGPGRKMGHVTALGATAGRGAGRARRAAAAVGL